MKLWAAKALINNIDDESKSENESKVSAIQNITKLVVVRYMGHPHQGIVYLCKLWWHGTITAKEFGSYLLKKFAKSSVVATAGLAGGMGGIWNNILFQSVAHKVVHDKHNEEKERDIVLAKTQEVALETAGKYVGGVIGALMHCSGAVSVFGHSFLFA
eukprot:408197_1